MDLKKDYLKYDEYELEDFLADEFFIQWVRFPDNDNSHFWEKWLKEHPQKSQLILEASHLIRLMRYSYSPELSDTTYTQLYEAIVRSDYQEEETHEKKNKWKWIFSFRQVAVFALILLMGGIYYWEVLNKNQQEEVSHTTVDYITKEVPKGMKTSLILEDGSKVSLNSGSKITFPAVFSDTARLVTLEGEAFFEVEHEDRPFKVQTAEAVIEVLGTSFNVNSSQIGLSVALVTGNVKINDTLGNRMILNPKEMLTISKKGKYLKEEFDPLEISGWKDKYLIFKKSDIEEVKLKLEYWYGVEIQLSGNFPESWAYSGIYLNESLENVLEGVSQTSSIQYSIDKKKVNIQHR